MRIQSLDVTLSHLSDGSGQYARSIAMIIAIVGTSLSAGCSILGDSDVTGLLNVDPCPAMYQLRPGQSSADLELQLLKEDGTPEQLIVYDPGVNQNGISFSQIPGWMSADGWTAFTVGHSSVQADTDAPVGSNEVGIVSLHSVHHEQANCEMVIDILAGGYYTFSTSGDTSITAGGQATINITLMRHGGYTGAVDLGVDFLSNGLSASLNPASLAPGATQSTLTITDVGVVPPTSGPPPLSMQIYATDSGANGGRVGTFYPLTYIEAPTEPGWQVVQDAADVGEFVDLDCPSSSVCYAVGSALGGGPTAYKTTNGGQTWSSLSNLGVSGEAFAVQFLDEMTGYIGGLDTFSETNGYLLKTTDGGASWTNVGANMPTNLAVRALHFFDANSGYAGGGANAVSDTTKVMYTANGGNTWVPLPWSGSINDEVLRMYFWSTNEGYVNIDSNTGQGRTYYTTDGGEDWTLATIGGWFRDVSGGLGVNGTHLLYSTTQPGMNWSTADIPDPDGFISIGAHGVATQGGRTWIAGSNGGAYVAFKEGGVWTTDWNPGQSSGITELVDIEMFSTTEGVAIGRNFFARRVP